MVKPDRLSTWSTVKPTRNGPSPFLESRQLSIPSALRVAAPAALVLPWRKCVPANANVEEAKAATTALDSAQHAADLVLNLLISLSLGSLPCRTGLEAGS